MCRNSAHPFKILSHTVTSRENAYHIFHFLGEPKTLLPTQKIIDHLYILKELCYNMLTTQNSI